MQRETEETTNAGSDYPFIQWGNGLTNIVQNVKGKWQGSTPAIGFLFPRTEAVEDYTDLDLACQAAGYVPISVKHGQEASAHWHTQQLKVLVLTTKLPRLGRIGDDQTALKKEGAKLSRFGISYGWRILKKKGADSMYRVQWNDKGLPKYESFSRPLVLVPDLLAQGYDKPLMLTFKGQMTQEVEVILRRHFELQDTILNDEGALAFINTVHETLVNDLGVEDPGEWRFPFYGSYLTLGEGEQKTFGTGEESKDLTAVGIVEPETLDSETLVNMCADANERLCCMQYIDEAIAWSIENSERGIRLSEETTDEIETEKAKRRALNAAASRVAA